MDTDLDEDLHLLRELLGEIPIPQHPPDTEPDTDTHAPRPKPDRVDILDRVTRTGLPRLLVSHTARTELLPQLLRRLGLPADLLASASKIHAWRTIHNAVVRAGYDPETWLPLHGRDPATPTPPKKAGHHARLLEHLYTHESLRWDQFRDIPRTTVWQTVSRLRKAGWQIVTRWGAGYDVLTRKAPFA